MILEPATTIEGPVWEIAESLAADSDLKMKHGAVIINRKGKILGFGYNENKTHPRYGSKEGFHTLHAEGNAIWCSHKLGNNVRGATMVVYRKGGRYSKPCKCCQRHIKKAGIAKVIYSDNNE